MNPIDILEECGIKTSHQRVVILRYLLDHDTHPTADTVYNNLSPQTAGLSKTTVYNTMRLFAAKGLVEELSIDGREQRFDVKDSTHGHFQCKSCKNIYDIPIQSNPGLAVVIPPGFQVEERQLYLKGLCSDCARR
jgi:Fe2+ or Zn2+ uptake regulation protein